MRKESMPITSRDAQISVNGAFAQAENAVTSLVAAGVIEVSEAGFVEDVATLVTQLGTAFARNRLAVIADVTSEYPDAAPRRSGGAPRAASGGAKQVSDPTAAISDGQVKFIKNLLEEKVWDGEVDFDSLNMGAASALIDALKAAPTA